MSTSESRPPWRSPSAASARTSHARRASRGAQAFLALLAVAAPLAGRSAVADGAGAELHDTVFADGEGLPPGAGDTVTGAALYASGCADCHGAVGEGGSAPELVGDPASLDTGYPDRGIAARWPYAPPLFDYVRRAMPSDAPGSLDADATYALVARLLELNGLVAAGSTVDARVLSSLQMPVRDRFVDVDVDD